MNKALIQFLSAVAPSAVVSMAYKTLANPQIKKLRPHEIDVLDQAKKERFAFKGFDIQLYAWGTGEKTILLIHGWEGQAGNFADIIDRLRQANYRVYAFDAPSHGFSSRGKTSLFEFTELAGVMIRKYGVDTLMSHSFGGVATTYALFQNQDLLIDKYVLLTTPDRFMDRIQYVSDSLGIPEKVKNRLVDRLNRETGQNAEDLNVSDFVKSVQVKQALILHDKNDKVIPLASSQQVCRGWGSCRLVEVEGTGHFRILREASVMDQVMVFLEG
ncbi:MAG TPA: hypothetical protein DCR93_28435 [Cytophagales bacterium]|nr:hypothetical protein [Cytophagales bacterium]